MVQWKGSEKFQESTNTPPLPLTFRVYGYRYRILQFVNITIECVFALRTVEAQA